MIEHPHVDIGKNAHQALGQRDVRLRGLGHSGRVIVRENDGGGIVAQRRAQDLARVHRRAVDSAARQHLESQYAVAVIEPDGSELLLRMVAKAGSQEGACVLGATERVAGLHLLGEVPARQLQHRLQLRVFRSAEATAGAEGGAFGAQQAAQTAKIAQQVARQIDRATPGNTGTQEHGEELGIAQRIGPQRQQLLSRALPFWPVADTHDREVIYCKFTPRALPRRRFPRAWGLRYHAPMSLPAHKHRILLGVTGGIAAYKSAELVRLLRKADCEVQVVLTRGGAHFITPTTLQALSGRIVRQSLWDEAAEAAMGHIELARWPDLVCIAPASADCVARLAHGLADDLLGTLCLASDRPLLIAPAMNRLMWAHPATQANIETLRARGAHIVGPAAGDQACGETGEGRMTEPQALLEAIQTLLADAVTASAPPTQHLAGLRVVITAGPTREAVDPVRVLSNRSSGRMGFALAEAAARAGAKVTLIAGPVSLPAPAGVTRIDVESAADMAEASSQAAADADLFIGCAAVADYRPTAAAAQKIKKREDRLSLELERTEDILLRVRGEQPELFLVGFAAETEAVAEHARGKLQRKGLQMIAANDVSGGQVFDREDNSLTLFTTDGEIPLGSGSKVALAQAMVAAVGEHYARHRARQPVRIATGT